MRDLLKKLGLFALISMNISATLAPSASFADNKDRDRDRERESRRPVESGAVNAYLTKLGIEDLTQFNLTLKLEPIRDEVKTLFAPESADALASIFKAFAKPTYNSAFILGQPGVGKTHLINQLVGIFSFGHVPDFLKDKISFDDPRYEILWDAFVGKMNVIMVDTDLLSANPRKANEPFSTEEVRMRAVLNGLIRASNEEFKATGKRTLFIFDEVATLPPIVSQSLKKILDQSGFKNPRDPFEARFDLGFHIVQMTTPDEFRAMVDGDNAIRRRGVAVNIPEPSEEAAFEMMTSRALQNWQKYFMEMDPEAIRYILHMRELLHFPPVSMPASVLGAVDDIYLWFIGKSHDQERITLRDAQRFVVEKAGLTQMWIEGPNGEPPFQDLAAEVKKYVKGHDEIVDRIAERIRHWAVYGLGGPPPVFLLGGPTGSGKDTIYKAFSRVLFGHDSQQFMFSIGGIGGFGIESLTEGPPVGNHSDDQPPLILKAMQNSTNVGFIGLNEGKDTDPKELNKLKLFLESGYIRPRGRDAAAYPLKFPIWILGEWGTDLFESVPNDKIVETYRKLSNKQIDEAFLNPADVENKTGAIPRSILQRVKKSGGVFIVPPNEVKRYPEIVSVHFDEIRNELRARNDINISVSEEFFKLIADETVSRDEDARGLVGTLHDLLYGALSRANEKGFPIREARVHLEVRDKKVVVRWLDKAETFLKEWEFSIHDIIKPLHSACNALNVD